MTSFINFFKIGESSYLPHYFLGIIKKDFLYSLAVKKNDFPIHNVKLKDQWARFIVGY